MKTKLVYILLLSIFYLSSQAEQQYKSVLNNGMARWSILDYHVVDAGFISTELVATDDTLINSITYKKIYIDQGLNIDYENRSDEEINMIWKEHIPELSYNWIWENFFIRESADASKLYIYDTEKNEEHLIMNLDLKAGDKFEVFDPYNGIFELTVDSAYTKNDLKHIRFAYKDEYFNGEPQFTFIESVGPTKWYIYPYYVHGFQVNCFYNQAVFYKNMEKNSLYICPCGFQAIWYPDNLKENKEIGIAYLIQKNNIQLQFADLFTGTISLFDATGRLQRSLNASNTLIQDIDIAHLQPGIYVLTIKNNEDKFLIIKIRK